MQNAIGEKWDEIYRVYHKVVKVSELFSFRHFSPNFGPFLIFDTSGETMCNNITNRYRSTSLKLQRT